MIRSFFFFPKLFIQERLKEVDKLLCKTQQEMHEIAQSGGCFPKPLNGPTPMTQLKPNSDSVQNSTSFSSQVKGKKKEQNDRGSETPKQELLAKPEDGDPGQSKVQHMLKSEIAKITDKGGLVDLEAVEKLVKLMQFHSPNKKIDLASRTMLVNAIAITDKADCLGRFVQLRGVHVLDEWLQEIQKGKIGDGSTANKNDESVEKFLLVVLRALDKLPVNVHALKTSNVGNSVCHLWAQKNSEIQEKAWSLLNTWYKLKEPEMNMNDVKSNVSGPSKPKPSEVKSGKLIYDNFVIAKNETGTKVEGINQSHKHGKSGAHQRGRSGIIHDSQAKAKTPLFYDNRKIDNVNKRMVESNVKVVSKLAATSDLNKLMPSPVAEVHKDSLDGKSEDATSPLDFDLNAVPNERVLEDAVSSPTSRPESKPRDRVAGALDLDLNRVYESPDTEPFLASNSSRVEIPVMPHSPSLPTGLSTGVINASRDFDLNSGPSLDEVSTETGGATSSKRKEPDGGWDGAGRFSYKHSSWK